MRYKAVTAAATLVVAAFAHADSVQIQSSMFESGDDVFGGTGVSYLADLTVNPDAPSSGSGQIVVELTNTSSVPGIITGFYFRSSAVNFDSMTLDSTVPESLFDNFDDDASKLPPFGQFDGGASLSGDPKNGLEPGETGQFTFGYSGASAGFSALDFLGSLTSKTDVGFMVRFQSVGAKGFDSDKVGGIEYTVTIPLPGASALAATGLALVGLRRRR